MAQYAKMDLNLHRVELQDALALRYQLSACNAAYLWLVAELNNAKP